MRKFILIHANCANPHAKGDYAFAGNIARDLVRLLALKNINDIDVTLISNHKGYMHFLSLYQGEKDGKVNIEGTSVGVVSFEDYDVTNNKAIAFVDANRCEYTSSDILKRVLDPTSKFLFIGNLNQSSYTGFLDKELFLQDVMMQQQNVYSYFDQSDILIGSAGLGKERLGIPELKSVAELSKLGPSEKTLGRNYDSQTYGFLYLAILDYVTPFQLIAQYLSLTGLKQYYLVGDFEGKLSEVKREYDAIKPLKAIDSAPEIHCVKSIPNLQMRKLVANVADLLVVSTGVTSTLEVLKEGKLPFYQYLTINQHFVDSYLKNIKILIDEDTILPESQRSMIYNLAKLLFAPKPLPKTDLTLLHSLLNISGISSRLVEKNLSLLSSKITAKSLGEQILDFISVPSHSSLDKKVSEARLFLRKPGETDMPELATSIRRAALWGKLFELKILLLVANKEILDSKDPKLGRSAIHWATTGQQRECVSILAKSGASVDLQDKEGKTPLHVAVFLKNRFLINLLLISGASLEIKDSLNHTAEECTSDPDLSSYIRACKI